MAERDALTTRLGLFAATLQASDIPPAAKAAAVRCIVDVAGCMIAGGASLPSHGEHDSARTFTRFISSVYGPLSPSRGPCTVFLASMQPGEASARARLPPSAAALANGVSAHTLDFDDYSYAGWAHASACVFPAALAVAEAVDASGSELFAAFVAGVEVIYAVGASFQNCLAMYERGHWTTGVLGPVGAAAAAARALRLTPDQTAHAIALAAGGAGGLRGVFGSDGKSFGNGRAAQQGVDAALYAQAGGRGALDIFESPMGLRTLNGGVGREESGCVAASGERKRGTWRLVSPGVSFKAIPACSGPQAAALAARRLVEPGGPFGRKGLKAQDVARVTIAAPANVVGNAQHPRPATAHEARFSMHWCVAAAVRFGKVGLAELLRADRFNDAALRALLPRVELRAATAGEAGPASGQGALVEIEARDGRKHERLERAGLGDFPLRPMSDETLDAKFMDLGLFALRDCGGADGASATRAAAAVLDNLRTLEGAKRAREIFAPVAPAPKRA
jgi:2-methylcitrate dehydratase PrpD